MKTRAKVRLITFALAVPVLLGGFWLDAQLSLRSARTQLEYVYLRALGDLTDYVSGMGDTLHKSMYAGSPATRSALSAQLLEQAGGAKSAMAALPFSGEKSDRFNRFLSQAGDYAMALSRKTFSGAQPDSADLENLKMLREYAGKLTEALTGLQARLTAEGDSLVQDVHLLNNLDEIDNLAVLDNDFDEVSEEFSTFPALLYDGPFSDHISRREPLSLAGSEGVTPEQARAEAAKFLNCSEDSLGFTGEGGGNLPVYSFTTEDSMVNITRQGGRPVYFKKAGGVSAAKFTIDQARRAAEEYLSGLGYGPMELSYFLINDNMAGFNFHGSLKTVDGQTVICYPDLMKVTVELEQGGTIEFDATGYVMNNHTRSVPAPKVSLDEVKNAVNPLLRVESGRLAIVPTPGLEELLCWELHCTAADGQEVLSYVNAETGLEEQLYILQKDEQGTLAN